MHTYSNPLLPKTHLYLPLYNPLNQIPRHNLMHKRIRMQTIPPNTFRGITHRRRIPESVLRGMIDYVVEQGKRVVDQDMGVGEGLLEVVRCEGEVGVPSGDTTCWDVVLYSFSIR